MAGESVFVSLCMHTDRSPTSHGTVYVCHLMLSYDSRIFSVTGYKSRAVICVLVCLYSVLPSTTS